LVDRESLNGSSKRLRIRDISKLLFVAKEETAALSEQSSYSPLNYSIMNMLSCKAKYFV